MAAAGFSKGELGLVGTAAALVFTRVFGLSVVLPNFRTHYDVGGIDPFWVGVAFSVYGLTMAVMQFPNGVLSDKFGRRPLMWSATVFFVAGSLLCAFATDIGVLIAGRLLQGMGAVASVAVAAVGETLPASRRTMGMALVGIPAGTGFLVGMAAGPVLYPMISMQGLFLVTAFMGALAALPLLRVPLPARSSAPTSRRPLTPPVAALAMGGFAANYVMTTALFFLQRNEGWVFPILMTAGLISMLTLSRVIDRRGWTWQPLTVAAVGIAFSLAVFTLVPSAGFWVGGAMFFVFHSILATVLPSQVSRVAGPSGGRGHGIQNVIAYAGTFAAGPLAGLLASRPDVAVAIAATLSIGAGIAILSAMGLPQRSKRPTPGAEPEP